eukprot:TRINITY_DN7614_c0_g2_i4.p1 TRINITY_DN7614_c0_g2~~TRINITY_DN7614_c0_g2_i4.p1  ORF type:complete len:133 (-),score=29.98 TRINITY_DN7614_c0_g2_i4:79-477(-)
MTIPKELSVEELPLPSLILCAFTEISGIFEIFGLKFLEVPLEFRQNCATIHLHNHCLHSPTKTQADFEKSEENFNKILKILVKFRNDVRSQLKASEIDKKRLWGLVDQVRDELPAVGISLKDSAHGSIVKKK